MFKLVMILGTFLVIFCGLILSKMTVLLAATNARLNMSVYCATYLINNESYKEDNHTIIKYTSYKQCLTTANNYELTNNEPCLQPRDSNSDVLIGSPSEFQLCESISIRWIWCLTLILITPEFFVFLRCLWTASFKNEDFPSKMMLLIVSTITNFISMVILNI